MSIYYADSSVRVKRHVLETGSPWVQDLFDQSSENAVVTSRVSMLEVLSAFCELTVLNGKPWTGILFLSPTRPETAGFLSGFPNRVM